MTEQIVNHYQPQTIAMVYTVIIFTLGWAAGAVTITAFRETFIKRR